MAARGADLHFDKLFKLVLIGDSGAGKTALLNRFADEKFVEEVPGSMGIEFKFRFVTIGGKTIKLQLWDTAGQERFRTVTAAYYRGADGIILCYDVTSMDSFDHVEEWLSEVNRHASEGTRKLLIGNKIDLADKKEVPLDNGQRFADKIDIPFVETSAKTGAGVNAAFMQLTEAIIKHKEGRPELPSSPSLLLHQSPPPSSTTTSSDGSCCGGSPPPAKPPAVKR